MEHPDRGVAGRVPRCACVGIPYSLVLRHMRNRVLAPANQLISKIMDRLQGPLESAARATGAFAPSTPAHADVRPSPAHKSSPLILGGALATAMLVAVVAALIKTPGDAVILGLLTVLGIIGVFFLFAASVGLVQFGVRDHRQVLEHLIMRSPDGVLIAAADGTTVRQNGAFDEIQRALANGATDERQGLSAITALEAFFHAGSDGEGGFFRLMRAARVGESAEELVHIENQTSPVLNGNWRVSITGLLDSEGIDRATEWRVTRLPEDTTHQLRQHDPLARDTASFERVPTGMLIVSREGRILSANAAMRARIGFSIDAIEVDGVAFTDIFPDGQAAFDSVTKGMLTDQIAAPHTLKLRTVNQQQEIVCRATFAPHAGPQGRVVVAVEELPVLPRENAVNLSKSQGANLFNAAPIAIAVVDASGAIESANDAFARMFGDDIGNLIESVTPETRDHVQFALNAATDGDLHPAPVEIAVGKEGKTKGRVFISPAHPDGAEGDMAIVYAIDLTKQRELEAQFAQGQKMQAVGQLAGGMAHDFNNLLTIITLSSDFLLSSHQKSDPAFKDIMQIKQVAGRAAEIVKQLLAFSRQQTLLPEILSLTDEISDWTTTLRPLLGERVTLDTDNGRDLWMVKADKSQLGQVIVNLAVNARDAMAEDGAVTIRTRNVPARDVARLAEKEILPVDYVMCEVSDTGTGMPDDVRDKIFDPFFSTKEVGKGTGLGLSTVYGIIKQTGGYIFCDSTLGKGTTFRIYLPRHDQHIDPSAVAAPVVAVEKPANTDMTGSGLVLLVEDEEPVRRLAARALKRQGFDVLEAGSGVEALEVMREVDGKVDLVVSDIVMPEMDGPTLLKELRKQQPDMKLIFISGYAEDALQTLNPEEEFEFLPKPFQLAELVAKVKATLGT